MMNEELLRGKILGDYATFDDARDDAVYCSQAEVLLRMLNGDNVFLSGSAGAGKSYVIEQYVKLKREINSNTNIVVTATTGLAALNISGSTVHSVTGLGITKLCYDDYRKTTPAKTLRAKNSELRAIDVLIIDEVSMLSAQGLNFIVDRFIDAKGGLPQIILAGDFNQLPPVATQQDIQDYGNLISEFCYKSRGWDIISPVICYLDKSWRAKDQRLKIILENISIGQGRSPETIDLLNTIRTTDNIDQRSSSILMTKNIRVDSYNEECQKLNTNSPNRYIYKFDNEFAKNYAKKLGIPEMLVFKDGDRVMITQNYSINGESVMVLDDNGKECNLPVRNGMIGTFTLWRNLPSVKYTRDGRNFIIIFKTPFEYVCWNAPTVYDIRSGSYNAKADAEAYKPCVYQYPLKLAYAISVHKSQGQTLDNIIVDLTECWTENLGYVALSRTRSLRDITLLKRNGRLGSQKALLVSEKSLKIKEEILEASLNNRLERHDWDEMIHKIMH